MENIIIIGIVVLIVVGIISYLYKQKKQGAKCVGCPYAKKCGGNCSNDSDKKG